LAVSIDEANGDWIMQAGATQGTGAITYSSPSASNATLRLSTTCGARGAGTGAVAELVMTDVVLTATELMRLYDATKGRF
jgi:hypothetical protein